MGFFIYIFCIRYCAYQGSKRVIGSFHGFAWGLLGIIGVLTVRSSRRLDDKQLDEILKERYAPEIGVL